MFTNLLLHIEKFVMLGEEDKAILLQYIKHKKLKKKELLLKEGQVCTATYFVSKGCMRMYYVNNKGIEQTTHFAIENWWLADYQSLDKQAPSQFYIQAIEACDIILLERRTEEELFEKLPVLERYFRLIFQKAVAASQLKVKYIDDFTGEELYRHFSGRFPEFVQRVPQYMLASYLGFTPEFLSKIRAKKL
jgi:CRP/FNR family transcriptional regulator